MNHDLWFFLSKIQSPDMRRKIQNFQSAKMVLKYLNSAYTEVKKTVPHVINPFIMKSIRDPVMKDPSP